MNAHMHGMLCSKCIGPMPIIHVGHCVNNQLKTALFDHAGVGSTLE